jgi:uncharacterized protein (UPF0262 family)
MTTARIIAIHLDEDSLPPRGAHAHIDRAAAIADLISQNSFALTHESLSLWPGPFALTLRSVEGRLAFEIYQDDGETHVRSIILGLAQFRRLMRDYAALLHRHHHAVADPAMQQIETIDMARRGLHNQGADLLIDRLKDKIEIDFETARRLFTLIHVLHARS